MKHLKEFKVFESEDSSEENIREVFKKLLPIIRDRFPQERIYRRDLLHWLRKDFKKNKTDFLKDIDQTIERFNEWIND